VPRSSTQSLLLSLLLPTGSNFLALNTKAWVVILLHVTERFITAVGLIRQDVVRYQQWVDQPIATMHWILEAIAMSCVIVTANQVCLNARFQASQLLATPHSAHKQFQFQPF
jgi:hypothetical protein